LKVFKVVDANSYASYDDSLFYLRVFSSIGIISVFRDFCAGAGSIVVISQHGAGN